MSSTSVWLVLAAVAGLVSEYSSGSPLPQWSFSNSLVQQERFLPLDPESEQFEKLVHIKTPPVEAAGARYRRDAWYSPEEEEVRSEAGEPVMMEENEMEMPAEKEEEKQMEGWKEEGDKYERGVVDSDEAVDGDDDDYEGEIYYYIKEDDDDVDDDDDDLDWQSIEEEKK